MKQIVLILVFSCFLFACGNREREIQLEKKMKDIEQREMQVTIRENALLAREEELAKKEKHIDSSAIQQTDSARFIHPEIQGRWNVVMRCTETNCAGSAVGDVKNEQWEITLQDQVIHAKAFSDKTLVREYTGNFSDNGVEIATVIENADPSILAKMLVRIKEVNQNEMNGEREIIRPDCRILYSLNFKKQ